MRKQAIIIVLVSMLSNGLLSIVCEAQTGCKTYLIEGINSFIKAI